MSEIEPLLLILFIALFIVFLMRWDKNLKARILKEARDLKTPLQKESSRRTKSKPKN